MKRGYRCQVWISEASHFGSRHSGQALRQEQQVSDRGCGTFQASESHPNPVSRNKRYKLLILGTSKGFRRFVDMSGC